MYSSTNVISTTPATFNGIATTNNLPNPIEESTMNTETQTPVNPAPTTDQTDKNEETAMNPAPANAETPNTESATTNTDESIALEGIEFDLSTAKKENGRYTDEFKAKVVQLKTDKKVSYSVIKENLKVSQKAVSDWVKDANPTPAKALQTPSELLQTNIDEKQAKIKEIEGKISDKVKDLLQEKELLEAEIESYRIALDTLLPTDSETVA